MVNSRLISDLDPEAAIICSNHVRFCRNDGIELLITSTWRDYEAQNNLWAIGRTVHMELRKVTNAKGGHSWHNFKAAWDVVPLVYGKCDWASRYTKGTQRGQLTPLWARVVQLGMQVGALAGANWKGDLVDDAHFYIAPIVQGLHIGTDEARARFDLNGTIFVA